MDRRNEAYMMRDKMPGSLDSANRILEFFRTIDTLKVKHMFSCMEALTGIAMQAKYAIFDNQGNQVLLALEESSFCQRCCCAPTRGFILHILDPATNQEVIRVRREFVCCSGCCWCGSVPSCMQEVVVELPPGNIIGTVKQEGSCWHMNYVIKDTQDVASLFVHGPCCICDGACCCCCENKFAVIRDI